MPHCTLCQTRVERPLRRINQGSCEINKEIDCAWQLILNRLNALGQMDRYETLAPLKDWSKDRAGGPRKQIREEIQE